MEKRLTRKDIYEIWKEKFASDQSVKCQHVVSVIRNQFDMENLSEKAHNDLRHEIYRVCSKIAERWKNCNRMEERFLIKNTAWLEETIDLPDKLLDKHILPGTSSSVGRKPVSFGESSERSKRRKTESLRQSCCTEELVYAAQLSLRASGQADAANLIKEAASTSPTRAKKIRNSWETRNTAPLMPYSSEEALSLFVTLKFTKRQYIQIRTEAKARNANIYPAYQHIRAAKERCYPPRESIIITYSLVEVNLQAILDHTCSRILQAQAPVLENFTEANNSELTLFLVSKWGCDGSSGHSQYKQRATDTITDSDMFIVSFVPLQLFTNDKTGSIKKILWQNPRPSSIRYCRPIRMQFAKETTDLSVQEISYIEEQINNLVPTCTTVSNKSITVTHRMLMTMVDGKICNAVSHTASSQVCYICKATPKEMNNIESVKEKNVHASTYTYGLSTLHAWIRFMECFLHISYRLEIKKWQIRKDDKDLVDKRKKSIQKEFKERFGLLIDQVNPGGSGTTNDGNTARRFFQAYQESAQITGVNEELLRRSAVILQTMSSGFEINADAFDKYAHETGKLFVHNYPWFYMPASVHKVLVHGSHIISHALVPIGQLSEEAQECRHKDLKSYRRNYSRKMSRSTTNEDIFHLLLVSSDPLISSLTPPCSNRKHKQFLHDVFTLIKSPEVPVSEALMNTSSASDSVTDSDMDSDF